MIVDKKTSYFLAPAIVLIILFSVLLYISFQSPQRKGVIDTPETDTIVKSKNITGRKIDYFKRGRSYLHKGENHAAIDAFKVVLEENPGHLAALRAIGFAYYRLGNKEMALSYWNEALQRNPEDFVVKALIKSAEQSSGEITHPPDSTDAKKEMPPIKSKIYLEGDKYFHERKYEKAIERFKETIKTVDNDFRVYFALGAAYREIENVVLTSASWKKASELSPENIWLRQMLKQAEEKLHIKNEIKGLEKKVEEKPEDWENHLILAEKYLVFNSNLTTQGGQEDKYLNKAYKELKTVIKFLPTHIVSLRKLEELAIELGKFGEAIEFKESIVKLQPNNVIYSVELERMKKLKRILDKAMEGLVNNKNGKINLDKKMAFIPGGEFILGSKDTTGGAREDETPEQKIFLKSFYIDKYEVTRFQFKKFMESANYSVPVVSPSYFQEQWGFYPVSNVTYTEANEYCRWAGKRLPNEKEWEKAARGTDGRRFPWGNKFKGDQSNTRLSTFKREVPVGGYPESEKPYGVFQMSGNVQEWTDSLYKKYPGNTSISLRDGDYGEKFRVIRGGSFQLDPMRSTATARNYRNPDYRAQDLGFRCAKDS